MLNIDTTLCSSVSVSVSDSTQFLISINDLQNTQIQRTESTTARHVLLSEEEISSVFDSATNCAEGECSVEDVSALISELKDQKSQMQERLQTIENMVYKLEHLNESENREIDEVRQTVRDFLRVFNTDVSIEYRVQWLFISRTVCYNLMFDFILSCAHFDSFTSYILHRNQHSSLLGSLEMLVMVQRQLMMHCHQRSGLQIQSHKLDTDCEMVKYT